MFNSQFLVAVMFLASLGTVANFVFGGPAYVDYVLACVWATVLVCLVGLS